MILDSIKKIFCKNESSNANAGRCSTTQPTSDRKLSDEEKMFDFDLMVDKLFIYLESAYRHQEIVVRRATESNRLTLGDVLTQLFDEKSTSVVSMAVAYRSAESDTSATETIIDDANDIWNYNLFSCILKRKVDEHYSMGMYHETTLMIHTITNTYIMVLTSLGGIDTVKYMRTTILVPNNSAKDDGMSLKTENAPVSFSIILSYSELDENPVFAKYDQVQNDVKRKQEQNIVLDELELEFVNGQYEFHGYGYIGYGKWLFEQNRYYDTFSILERAFNFIRMKNLDTQNQELVCALFVRWSKARLPFVWIK